jgi:hypothetical protein
VAGPGNYLDARGRHQRGDAGRDPLRVVHLATRAEQDEGRDAHSPQFVVEQGGVAQPSRRAPAYRRGGAIERASIVDEELPARLVTGESADPVRRHHGLRSDHPR